MKRLGIIVLALTIAVMSKNTVEAKQPTAACEKFKSSYIVNDDRAHIAHTSTKVCGKFKFTYTIKNAGAHITNITPLSSKGIKTLVIPKTLGGMKVVELTGEDDYGKDLFGLFQPEEGNGEVEPKSIYNKVKKIKTICVPESVETISNGCFAQLPDGKNINIPKCADDITGVRFLHNRWGKITISPKSKYLKISDGCLLSKDGKEFLNIVKPKKTVIIPNGVKEISPWARMDKKVRKIMIPKSVTNIQEFGANLTNNVNIVIDKKNKKYAVKQGSIINKKTKELVKAYVKKGVCTIPSQVKVIGRHGYIGKGPKKIIISKNVKEIYSILDMIEKKDFEMVFERREPCELKGTLGWTLCETVTIYVPKGCKSKYTEKWNFDQDIKTKWVEK